MKVFKPSNRLSNSRSNVNFTKYDIEPAEVVDIILNSEHPRYRTELDIGAIIFRRIDSDFKKLDTQLMIARPENLRSFDIPLKHEIVMVYQSVVPATATNNKVLGFYYTEPLNVWSLTNHNGLPFATTQVQTNNKLNEFTGNIDSNNNEISFGETFNENLKVPNLNLFEGDKLTVGRWGQSIRFGSSNKLDSNNWSFSDIDNSNPITIITNTKPIDNNRFKTENINGDDSSIYLASNQRIEIELSSLRKETFFNKQIQNSTEYIGNQIILNSDRIVLNTKSNDIIITSNQFLNLRSNEQINIESENHIIIDSEKIYIGKGSNNESEPTVLGTQLLDTLTQLIDELLKATYPTAVGPTGVMLPPSFTTLTELNARLKRTKFILSKKTFLT